MRPPILNSLRPRSLSSSLQRSVRSAHYALPAIAEVSTGIIITSCAEEIIGEIIWEPFVLLPAIQDYYNNSSRARAGVFFAGLGCVTAQLSICIVLNSVSCGMSES